METLNHLLLERAHKFNKKREGLAPSGYKYDTRIGAWVQITDGKLLAESPDRSGETTKKNDIETGEDLKSE